MFNPEATTIPPNGVGGCRNFASSQIRIPPPHQSNEARPSAASAQPGRRRATASSDAPQLSP